jgi:hypothetical protein
MEDSMDHFEDAPSPHPRSPLADIAQMCDTIRESKQLDSSSLALMREADGLINGNRQADYGQVKDSFQDVADMWTGILRSAGVMPRDRAITPAQCLLMMTALKVQRQANRPKRDNVVDAHGYLGLVGQVEGY